MPFNRLPPMNSAGGPGPAELTFITSGTNGLDTTTYTFSAFDIGAAAADRRVIVGIALEVGDGDSGDSVTSATIAGGAATIDHQIANDFGDIAAIISRAVPTGTTADISFTVSTTCSGAGIFIYRRVGGVSGVPFDTANDITLAGNTTANDNINIPANGILVAVGGKLYGGAFSWTGATNRGTLFGEYYRWQSASASGLSAETGRLIQFVSGGPPVTPGFLVGASYQ